MDPAHMKMMAGLFPKGRFHLCPNGSHMDMYDDQKTYFEGLIGFIRAIEQDASEAAANRVSGRSSS
jgi:proline iminopeptidase